MTWRHDVALGDSLTTGVGDAFGEFQRLSWADRLAGCLAVARPSFRYQNPARPGATTRDILAEQLDRAVAAGADLYSVLAGGNDNRAPDWRPKEYRWALGNLIQALVATGATVIVPTMLGLPPIAPVTVRAPAVLRHRLRQLHQVVRAVSREHGALCIDLEAIPRLRDRRVWSADGLHPNALGYLRIADETVRQLEALTGMRIPCGCEHGRGFTPEVA